MLRSINYCFRNKITAAFYCDACDATEILVGYIVKFNDSEILIAHISPRGCYDGFVLRHIDDIYRIDYDGKYEKKIEKLYTLKSQAHSIIHTLNPDDDEILYSLLDFAKQNDYIVTMKFTDDSITGFVNGYSDEVVYLDVINDYGAENGISIININDVLMVALDTDHEQDVRILHDSYANS